MDCLAKEIWHYALSYMAPSDLQSFRQVAKSAKEAGLGLLSKKKVLVASGKSAYIFELEGNSLLHRLRHGNEVVLCCKFSNDGDRIVTSSADTLARIWQTETGCLLKLLKGHQRLVFRCAFSNHASRRVITASDDNTSRIWCAFSGDQHSILRHDHTVWNCAFSHSNQTVVTTAGSCAYLWSADSGQHELTLSHDYSLYVLCAAYSHDDQRLVTGSSDNRPRIWNATTGHLMLTLAGHTDSIWNCFFSPDNEDLVLTASHSGSVRLFDIQNKTQENDSCNHCCYSYETKKKDAAARLATSQQINSLLSTVSLVNGVRVWDSYSGLLLSEYKFMHSTFFCDLANC